MSRTIFLDRDDTIVPDRDHLDNVEGIELLDGAGEALRALRNTMTKKLSIGYLASCYPRAVDTSVRNEVLMLRKQGHTVRTFSVRRADTSQLLSEFHRQEVQTTTYLLSDHRIELIVAALQLLVKTPVRFFQGVLLSLRTKAPGLWGFVTQTAYFFEASLLARELQLGKGDFVGSRRPAVADRGDHNPYY